MTASNKKEFVIRHDELDLLAWNIANEVLHGFRVKSFDERIGTSSEDFKHVAIRLRAVPNAEAAALSVLEARAFRNALAITLEELGDDEFETRTGHSLEQGNALLKSLQSFLDGEDQS